MENSNGDFPQQVPPPPQQTPQSPEHKPKAKRSSAIVLAVILLIGLVGGGLIGYSLSYVTFNGKIDSLQAQLDDLSSANATYVSYANTSYVIGDNVSLASLYQQVKSSVVVIQDLLPQYNFFGSLVGYVQQQGSGFVMMANNQPVVVTNNHVVENSINVTVTFANGDSYPATQLGADPQADLAVLSVNGAISSDLQPLTVVASATLQVGDPVVAVGSPYGLSGTLTTGVISALGRTITESSSTGSAITIPDVIQTSTAINPGNSGGPLINYKGEVVGITTAGVSNSEGLGFAIPSGTILREVNSLVTTGKYDNHPSINADGKDMNYQIAQAIDTNVTYGWLVESVNTENGLKGGTSYTTVLGSQIAVGGDIIVGIGGTRITNEDALLSYLEQNTLPGQTVDFEVIRNGQTQTVAVTIEKLST
ncbi:MAG: trypsin-like peptidase domain-containing protein [Candidatus Bathyarchaeota archaeon]|nr:trypsin-like peptidase domain-containing protein [Candidatus Bathyarchaeota archaeon]